MPAPFGGTHPNRAAQGHLFSSLSLLGNTHKIIMLERVQSISEVSGHRILESSGCI